MARRLKSSMNFAPLVCVEERVRIFALLAAEFADVGDAEGDDGEGGIDAEALEVGVSEGASGRR